MKCGERKLPMEGSVESNCCMRVACVALLCALTSLLLHGYNFYSKLSWEPRHVGVFSGTVGDGGDNEDYRFSQMSYEPVQRMKREAEITPTSSTHEGISGSWLFLNEDTKVQIETLEMFCKTMQEYCPPGVAGPPGFPGAPGDPGDIGLPGSPGIQGEPGFDGPPGIIGLPGQKGEPGIRGPPGMKGDVGDRGEAGLKGADGLQGFPGRRGRHGVAGEPGLPGLTGIKGSKGQKGDEGDTGEPGLSGYPGVPGTPGIKGEPGEPGPTRPEGPPGNDYPDARSLPRWYGNDGLGGPQDYEYVYM